MPSKLSHIPLLVFFKKIVLCSCFHINTHIFLIITCSVFIITYVPIGNLNYIQWLCTHIFRKQLQGNEFLFAFRADNLIPDNQSSLESIIAFFTDIPIDFIFYIPILLFTGISLLSPTHLITLYFHYNFQLILSLALYFLLILKN